jgi:hypothetical protein
MRQTHVLTVLAIIAVTGAVSVPNGLAVAWRLNLGDRHVVDRGGLEWDSLIHMVGDTSVSPTHDPEYQTLGHPLQGPMPILPGDQSRYTGEYKSGSSSNESGYSSNPSDNYLQKDSSGPSNSPGPYGGSLYGGVPTTPSADPMIKELSR